MYLNKVKIPGINTINLRISPEMVFVVSSFIVNGGNYMYNMLIGRYLGPVAFAEAGLIITLLLVLSFLGMTFQIVTAKYIVELDMIRLSFYTWIKRVAILLGFGCTLLMIAMSEVLTDFFQASTQNIFYIFSFIIPFYFLMSVRRGVLQGLQKYNRLSATYQGEMWGRLLVTFLLLYADVLPSSITVTIGVFCSVILAYFLAGNTNLNFTDSTDKSFSAGVGRMVMVFVMGTVLYEFTQILINYGDLLMVKHYMPDQEAGLYTSLALIGRIIYFVAWMFVMLLLPDVVNKKKSGLPHHKVLVKYVSLITLFSASVVFGCYLFPDLLVGLLFGEAYSSIEPLLWKYGVATSFFAIANVFIYYFLAINRYLPLYLALGFAFIQLLLYTFFHDSISQVVVVQIITMGSLLVSLVIIFFSGALKR